MKVTDYIAGVIGSYHPFVVQGGAAVHMIDSLARGGHDYTCCAHEQAAGFAADGYAKVKGLGVAITTCGPGATNLLTAAASAYCERVPVLYLVGQQHEFQELPIVEMFKPVTVFARQVREKENLVSDLNWALGVSIHGPVLLNIFDEVYYSDILDTPGRIFPKSWARPIAEKIFGNARNAVSEGPGPYRFLTELKKFKPVVVTDIGNHGVWTKQIFPDAISDNEFGAMGYAIAASMGVARAGKSAVCITGDGSIQMNIQELATIAHHNMDIKIFILNNGGYGMIRCTQDKWLASRHTGCDLSDLPLVDFERVATAYGIPNRRWDTEEDYDFAEVLNWKGPILVNVRVAEDFGVL